MERTTLLCPPPWRSPVKGNRYMNLTTKLEPAAKLGMHTIWVKQGTFAHMNLDMFPYKPDIIVEHIQEILDYL